jgi:hypothetical protein
MKSFSIPYFQSLSILFSSNRRQYLKKLDNLSILSILLVSCSIILIIKYEQEEEEKKVLSMKQVGWLSVPLQFYQIY